MSSECAGTLCLQLKWHRKASRLSTQWNVNVDKSTTVSECDSQAFDKTVRCDGLITRNKQPELVLFSTKIIKQNEELWFDYGMPGIGMWHTWIFCSDLMHTLWRLTLSRLAKDSYGCVKWQPELPRIHTAKNQKKRKNGCWTNIRCVLSSTICQRFANYCRKRFPVSNLSRTSCQWKGCIHCKQTQTEWPFLLTTDGLLFHFEILVGFNISHRSHTDLPHSLA